MPLYDEEDGAIFQSTPPARGATGRAVEIPATTMISIHAPREGGDKRRYFLLVALNGISIHAPREGGDKS